MLSKPLWPALPAEDWCWRTWHAPTRKLPPPPPPPPPKRASNSPQPTVRPTSTEGAASEIIGLTSSSRCFVLSHFLNRRHQLRNLDPDHRALTRPALDIQKKIRSVQDPQPLAHVAQPDSFNVHVRHLLFGDAYAIVFNLDAQPPVVVRRSQLDFSAAQLRRQPMFQAILHHRLEQHAGHEGFQRRIVNVFHDVQIVFSESRHFDV